MKIQRVQARTVSEEIKWEKKKNKSEGKKQQNDSIMAQQLDDLFCNRRHMD